MFSESDSFYYCPTGDLTNTVQRLFANESLPDAPDWKRADDRFFWNKTMLQELIDSEVFTCDKRKEHCVSIV